MRKFNLIKLVLLRQYQRRILRYAKKYVVEPIDSEEEQEPPMTPAERLEEQMDNMNRVMANADKGDKIDKKILKRLVPEEIYEKRFPASKDKAKEREAERAARRERAMQEYMSKHMGGDPTLQ